MTRITKQEHDNALKIVKLYEKQCDEERAQAKIEKYKGLTQKNLLTKPYKTRWGKSAFLIGISRDGINFIDEDGEYTIEENMYGDKYYYTISGSKTVYDTYDLAFKNIVKKLKAAKKIS